MHFRYQKITGYSVALLGCLVLILVNGKTSAVQPPFPGQTADEALNLITSSLQNLAFIQERGDNLRTTVEIDGEKLTLDLHKYSIRSADFQVLVQNENGQLEPVEAPSILTYKGKVLELPGAEVRGSYSNGNLSALIYTSNGVYGIQSLAEIGVAGNPGDHVVYRDSDYVPPLPYQCGTNDQPDHDGDDEDLDNTRQAKGTGLRIADLGLDADYEFYVLNGSSVSATVQDMENIINSMEPIYESTPFSPINVTYEITTVIVRTVSGAPYTSTSPSTLLNQFGSTWSSSPEYYIRRDLAHLFTGKDLNGGVIGIAWLGTGCAPTNAYGLSQSRFTTSFTPRVALTAHEIGHNWNAGHCNGCTSCSNCCRIMCSTLGSCSGFLTTFGCVAASQITSYVNGQVCLSDLESPQSIPFFEDFELGLGDSKWSYNDGGNVSTIAVAEPSGTLSLKLDATGSGLYQDDEIRSNFILMSGLTNLTLSYYTQHRGVELLEELVVEYWKNTRSWVEINRIASDGTDQSIFMYHEHLLPADAYHNEFRVRFRTEVSSPEDNWFIDDVFISDQIPPTITGQPVSRTVCEGELVGITVSAGGSAPLSYQWFLDVVEIVGETSSTILFDPAMESDEGDYSCEVSNAYGSVMSDPATLTVITDAECQDGEFCNGTEFCSADGNCEPGVYPCSGQFCDEVNDQCYLPPGPNPTFSIEIVELDGIDVGPTPAGNVSVPSGSTLTVELFLRDWSPNGEHLRGYQTQIDSAGYTSGSAGSILPRLWSSTTDSNGRCSSGGPDGVSNPENVFIDIDDCFANATSPSGEPDPVGSDLGPWGIFSPCSWFDDCLPGTGICEAPSIDWVLGQVTSGTQSQTNSIMCDHRHIGAADVGLDGPVSAQDGTKYYLGTVVLEVSSDAEGTFTLCLDDTDVQPPYASPENSFLSDENNDLIVPIVLECATIAIGTEQCPYGDVDGNGDVNLNDLLCMLDGLSGLFTCPGVTFENLDIEPCGGGNGDLNLLDLFAMLDALSGMPACPCP